LDGQRRVRLVLLAATGKQDRTRLNGNLPYRAKFICVFIKDNLILEAAVVRISFDHLNGQTTLFRDASVALEEQLLPAKTFSHSFNTLASKVGVTEINLESIRTSIRSEVDQQVSSWENLS